MYFQKRPFIELMELDLIAIDNLGNAMTQYLKPYREFLSNIKPYRISNNLLGNTLDINKLCYSTVLYAVQGFVY